MTGHRRENIGEGFINICKAAKTIVETYPDLHIVYPVHLNPNVRATVTDLLSSVKNIHLIAPQDYGEFVYLMNHSHLILTDSGGVQEEAPSLGKPVLVMRNTTERPEGVEAGASVLVGSDTNLIVNTVSKLLTDGVTYNKMASVRNPYGDGQSSRCILDILKRT
jgi:UDP-N-acetylglucosamine 2-epimerase (non-hydrolysing)